MIRPSRGEGYLELLFIEFPFAFFLNRQASSKTNCDHCSGFLVIYVVKGKRSRRLAESLGVVNFLNASVSSISPLIKTKTVSMIDISQRHSRDVTVPITRRSKI